MTPRLKERYNTKIAPALFKDLGLSNVMETPRFTKVVINMGVGEAVTDKKQIDDAMDQLGKISGQKPKMNRARHSIASFKIREGMPIGTSVTLRGDRMWEFLDRLISVAIPRIRDFRGLNPKGFDGRGNYSFGVTEQLIFPEIEFDSVSTVRGMNITICTTAKTDAQAKALLDAYGFPFRKQGAQA